MVKINIFAKRTQQNDWLSVFHALHHNIWITNSSAVCRATRIKFETIEINAFLKQNNHPKSKKIWFYLNVLKKWTANQRELAKELCWREIHAREHFLPLCPQQFQLQGFEIQRKIVEFEGLVHHLNRPKFPKISYWRSTPTTSGVSMLLPGRNCNK